MSFRGLKKRLMRKRENRIKTRVETHKLKKTETKAKVTVFSENPKNVKSDYLIIEIYLFDELYSSSEMLELFLERMGDIVNV